MTPDQFASLSISRLESLTSIKKHRWSRYFNKKSSPRLEILERTASELNMTVESLVKGINLRRDIGGRLPKAVTSGKLPN